jgi:radical SAM protein with 4Fe4S-binding SPASM domain
LSGLIPLLDAGPNGAPPLRDFAGCAAAGEPGDAYDGLLRRLKREYVPYFALWELTHLCNLKCVMCYNEPLAEPELTTGECLRILGQLAETGTLRLTFSGGELLTRRDFFEIARAARGLGFALDLKTNGTLITPAIADEIAALAPVQVDLSLLGATDTTFDEIAGAQGSLRRMLRGAQLLRDRGVRVKLNTLLMDANIAERTSMLDLAAALGVEYEQVLKISPSDSGRSKAAERQLSQAQMAGALAADNTPFARRSIASSARTCSVGLSSCVISPYGVVYPCVELRTPAGDLRRQPFSDIWRDAPVFRDLRARHSVANLPECRECPLLGYCEGRCAGISWKETGDAYRGHTLACQQAQARFEQQHPGTPVPDTLFLARQREATRKARPEVRG